MFSTVVQLLFGKNTSALQAQLLRLWCSRDEEEAKNPNKIQPQLGSRKSLTSHLRRSFVRQYRHCVFSTVWVVVCDMIGDGGLLKLKDGDFDALVAGVPLDLFRNT